MVNRSAGGSGEISAYGGQLATTAHSRFRRDFNSFDTSSIWTLSGVGPNASVAVVGGNLVITPGTDVNQEIRITGRVPLLLTVPTRVAFGVKLSAKNTNQEVYLELVCMNDDGTISDTVVAAWRIAGTDTATTTNARYQAQNSGALKQSANSTVPAVTADTIYEIQLETDEVWFHAKTMDSVNARANSYVFQSVSPDPNKNYVPRIRVVNGAAAPAAATITLYYVIGSDYSDFQAEITGGSGDTSAGRALPTHETGTATITGSVTPAASTTVSGTSISKVLSAATTNPVLVKSTSGRLYGWKLANTSATWRYMKLFNKATAPTVGTDIPVAVIPLPPNSAVNADLVIPIGAFSAGIGYSIVAGTADNDATAIAAGDVVGHLLYS